MERPYSRYIYLFYFILFFKVLRWQNGTKDDDQHDAWALEQVRSAPADAEDWMIGFAPLEKALHSSATTYLAQKKFVHALFSAAPRVPSFPPPKPNRTGAPLQ